MTNYASSTTATQSMVSALFKSLYMQMAAALTVTGLTAYLLAGSASFWNMLATNPSMVWILLIAQIGLVIWLSARVMKMSMASATMLFIAYSVLTGVTLSSIFLVYSLGTIATTFFVTAGTFFVMSLVGYTTRMDLSRVGNVLYMMLIGLIIATVVNLFVASSTLYWITTYAGVIIFVGLIAWDTQKLRTLFVQYGTADEGGQRLALLGALTLYLDFINLFLFLLRIFGGGNRE
ncbi:MAG: Bax inhibitor-1/YccA family protein [Alistipes sp.]|nr:Bax inhibitor-1/YccA family protein [Alistipes sp.]